MPEQLIGRWQMVRSEHLLPTSKEEPWVLEFCPEGKASFLLQHSGHEIALPFNYKVLNGKIIMESPQMAVPLKGTPGYLFEADGTLLLFVEEGKFWFKRITV